jgi:hypothetical protein
MLSCFSALLNFFPATFVTWIEEGKKHDVFISILIPAQPLFLQAFR